MQACRKAGLHSPGCIGYVGSYLVRSHARTQPASPPCRFAVEKKMQAINIILQSSSARPQKSLNEIFELFMLERQHCKPSTIRGYRESWRHVAAACGANQPPSEIPAHDLAVWRSELALVCAPRTVNRIIGLLKTVCTFAVDRDYCAYSENPSRALKLLREEVLEIDPFTMDEMNLVFKSSPWVYRQYFQVSFWTGARPCELQALRWKDVDFKDKVMNITRARVRGIEGTPKTKRSRRQIPLCPPALEALAEQHTMTGSDQHNYVFANANGRPITKHMDSFWKKACIRADVRHRPPYQLRHSFASFMLAAGENPAYVAKLLGHTTTETLYRHYARWIPNANGVDGQKSLEQINRLRGE